MIDVAPECRLDASILPVQCHQCLLTSCCRQNSGLSSHGSECYQPNNLRPHGPVVVAGSRDPRATTDQFRLERLPNFALTVPNYDVLLRLGDIPHI